jgi:TIR domain
VADTNQYDVFISYRQREPDMSWVRKKLAPALSARKIRVFIDYRCFRLGAPVLKEMERGVIQSRYTLAVLSPEYLGSNFTEVENLMADHLGLVESRRRMLAVMFRECDPGIRMSFRLWLDMTDEAEFDNNVERLVDEICRDGDS